MPNTHGKGRPRTVNSYKSASGDVLAIVGPGPDRQVQLTLSNLAARRLMLAFGVNTARHGPEVKAILTGLNLLLIGIASGEETANPHGPDCPCSMCKEIYSDG